ncbi:MAG: MMPL family transporter [Proteobacteria bacterium]|nr:MMPL family transporter [Pseudomonadota bacterium]
MFKSVSMAYRRALLGWTGTVRRRAWLVVLVSVLLSVGAAVYLAQNLRINTDTEDMLSPDLAFSRLSKEVSSAFPQFSDNLVVVIDGQTPDLADDAARTLAAGLRKNPKLFGRVDDPAGSDFFRRNGFLYLDLKELYILSDRLAEAQPFLGALSRDPSLVGFFRMLGLAANEILKGQGGDKGGQPIEIARVLDAITAVAMAQSAGKFGQMSWQALMTGDTAKADKATANRRILVIQPALDYASLSPAADAMDGVREQAARLGLTPENGITVRLTGSAALAHEELKSVEKGMGVAGAVSLVLVIALLMLGLRSKRLVAATLATLVMGLIWTAAFAIMALGTLNLISVAFAVLFIGLSVDFGIHYGLRYQETMDEGEHHARALGEAAERTGGALTLCAVSAAIAFYSFLPTDYLGLAELGLIAGTGMFIALFANMTVLPAILTVLPHGGRTKVSATHKFAPFRPVFRSFIELNSRAVCLAALIAGVAAVAALPKATFDFDPLNLKNPDTESVAALFDLMADKRSSPYSVTILAPNLEAAKAVAKKVGALAEVDSTATLADYVPADQDEKLEVISSMAVFLGPAFAATDTAPPPTPQARRAAFNRLAAKLIQLAALKGDSPEKKAAQQLSRAMKGIKGDAALIAFETRLLRALPGRLGALNDALKAGPVNLKSLPPVITENQVAADGRARVEVYPKEDLRNRKALVRFVAAVRSVAANVTGSSVVILEAGNTVVGAFWQAGALSIVLIVLMLIIVLNRLSDAILVFMPLALAALLTVAASVVFNLPFNFANVIVLPLLFGLGVAGSIHLVARERQEHGVSRVLQTSTPRAVLFSALTTIGSFGSIALSSHPGTSSMGILLTIAIALSLGCTLVVLPALMTLTGRKGNR